MANPVGSNAAKSLLTQGWHYLSPAIALGDQTMEHKHRRLIVRAIGDQFAVDPLEIPDIYVLLLALGHGIFLPPVGKSLPH